MTMQIMAPMVMGSVAASVKHDLEQKSQEDENK